MRTVSFLSELFLQHVDFVSLIRNTGVSQTQSEMQHRRQGGIIVKVWHSPAAAVATEPGRIHHANSWLNISGERVTGKGPHDCHGTQISCAKGATCAHKSLSLLQKSLRSAARARVTYTIFKGVYRLPVKINIFSVLK